MIEPKELAARYAGFKYGEGRDALTEIGGLKLNDMIALAGAYLEAEKRLADEMAAAADSAKGFLTDIAALESRLAALTAPISEECMLCNGTGQVETEGCNYCGGSGSVRAPWLREIRAEFERAPHGPRCETLLSLSPLPCNCWRYNFAQFLESLISRLTASENARGKAEKDTARLDYLDDNPDALTTRANGWAFEYRRHSFLLASIRECIDAARAPRKEGTE
jgi:hypothetical protein